MNIGQQIKEKRKKDRISAEDLAIKLNLKKENIYKWERGSTPSNPEEFQRINDWLTGKVDQIPNYSNDHEKYVALLESTNRNLERSIQLSLIAIQEGQQVLQAKISAGLDQVLKISSILQNKPVEELRENASIVADAVASSLKKLGKDDRNLDKRKPSE